MLKLTNEEEVFALQLFDVRTQIEKLLIEENTQSDRLLTILRGHQAQKAIGQSQEGIMIERVVVYGHERIIVTKHGELP